MEQSLTYARTLLMETPPYSSSSSLSVTPIHIQPSSIHIQPSSSTPVHIQPSSSTPVQETHGVQGMETDQLEFETISISKSRSSLQSTGIYTLSNDIENTQENTSTYVHILSCSQVYFIMEVLIGLFNEQICTCTFKILFLLGAISGRPKRACTSLVHSYQEPNLLSRMRQDSASSTSICWKRNESKRTIKQETPAVHRNKSGKRARRNDHQVKRERERGGEREGGRERGERGGERERGERGGERGGREGGREGGERGGREGGERGGKEKYM